MTKNNTAVSPRLAPLMAAALLVDVFLQPFGRRAPLLTAQHGILCAAVQMAVFALLFRFAQTHAGRALRSRWFCAVLCLTLLFSAALEIVQGERFYSQAMRTGLPVELFLILLFLAVFYGVCSGLNALARTATAVLVLTGFSMVLLVLSVLPQLRLVNLQPAVLDGSALVRDFAGQFYLAPELVLWAVLQPNAPKAEPRRSSSVFLWLFAAQTLLCLLGEMTLGAAYQQEEQPLFTIARLGGISVFRRLDALHASVWLLLFLVKITLYLAVFVQSLCRCVHGMSPHSAYGLAVAGVIGIFLAVWGHAEQTAYRLQQAACLVLLLWLIACRVIAERRIQ